MAKKQIKEVRTPIATEMYLPNLSGLRGNQSAKNILGDYVPYTGATSNVDLGANNLKLAGQIGAGNTFTSFDSVNDILHVKTNTTAPYMIIQSSGTDSYPSIRLKNDVQNWNFYLDGGLGDIFGLWNGSAYVLKVTPAGNFDFLAGNLTTTGTGTFDMLGVGASPTSTNFINLAKTYTTNNTAPTGINYTYTYSGDCTSTITSKTGALFTINKSGSVTNYYGGYALKGFSLSINDTSVLGGIDHPTNDLIYGQIITITTNPTSQDTGAGTYDVRGQDIVLSGNIDTTNGNKYGARYSISGTCYLNRGIYLSISGGTSSSAVFEAITTSTATDAYSFKCSSTGAATNAYAFYLYNMSGATNKWCLYNNTAVNNFMGLDNSKTLFGTGADASIYYNGTNLCINTKEVGSGTININGTNAVADGTYNTGIGPLGNMGTITTKAGIITAITQAT